MAPLYQLSRYLIGSLRGENAEWVNPMCGCRRVSEKISQDSLLDKELDRIMVRLTEPVRVR